MQTSQESLAQEVGLADRRDAQSSGVRTSKEGKCSRCQRDLGEASVPW